MPLLLLARKRLCILACLSVSLLIVDGAIFLPAIPHGDEDGPTAPSIRRVHRLVHAAHARTVHEILGNGEDAVPPGLLPEPLKHARSLADIARFSRLLYEPHLVEELHDAACACENHELLFATSLADPRPGRGAADETALGAQVASPNPKIGQEDPSSWWAHDPLAGVKPRSKISQVIEASFPRGPLGLRAAVDAAVAGLDNEEGWVWLVSSRAGILSVVSGKGEICAFEALESQERSNSDALVLAVLLDAHAHSYFEPLPGSDAPQAHDVDEEWGDAAGAMDLIADAERHGDAWHDYIKTWDRHVDWGAIERRMARMEMPSSFSP